MADKEDDKYFILEMQLTRNLSILPLDVLDASEMESATADRESEECSDCPVVEEKWRFSLEPRTKDRRRTWLKTRHLVPLTKVSKVLECVNTVCA